MKYFLLKKNEKSKGEDDILDSKSEKKNNRIENNDIDKLVQAAIQPSGKRPTIKMSLPKNRRSKKTRENNKIKKEKKERKNK